MNIQHSSRSDLWYTPMHILERVHSVLGSVDFDPASDDFGNSRVKATRYLGADGTNTELWPNVASTVFVNPPGGKTGRYSNAVLFWEALMAYRGAGLLTDAVFMSFSVEHLQTTQNRSCLPMLAFPICIPRKRIRFDHNGPTLKTSPSHSNAIVYVHGLRNRTEQFTELFADIGYCTPGSPYVV